MTGGLSDADVQALVVAAAGDRPAPGSPTTTDRVAVYNFRRPDRASKEHLRALQLLHDRFARHVSTSLSAFLRAMTDVHIMSVEQYPYAEFLASLPDLTAFYSLDVPPLDGLGALELNPSIAFAVVDRMLGGTGETAPPARALTEIEQHVIDSVVKLVADTLTETWQAAAPVQVGVRGRETRPRMLQVTGLNEAVIVLAFDIRVAEARGTLHLCYPAAAIELVAGLFEHGWQRARRDLTGQETAWLQANLGRVPVPVTAVIESRLSARELLALVPGDVVALGHPVREPIRVKVGQVDRYDGRPMATDASLQVVLESSMTSGETAA